MRRAALQSRSTSTLSVNAGRDIRYMLDRPVRSQHSNFRCGSTASVPWFGQRVSLGAVSWPSRYWFARLWRANSGPLSAKTRTLRWRSPNLTSTVP